MYCDKKTSVYNTFVTIVFKHHVAYGLNNEMYFQKIEKIIKYDF